MTYLLYKAETFDTLDPQGGHLKAQAAGKEGATIKKVIRSSEGHRDTGDSVASRGLAEPQGPGRAPHLIQHR